MSESKTKCPLCAREPGEQHHDECPRSQRHQRDFALGQKLYQRLCRARFLWLSTQLIDKPVKGARKAVVRYKDRRRSHPIATPSGVDILTPLYRIPRMGTYVKRLHGPLPLPPKEQSAE